jgi:hypothetical protein
VDCQEEPDGEILESLGHSVLELHLGSEFGT